MKKNIPILIVISCLIFGGLSVIMPKVQGSETIFYVDDDGTADYIKIQDAINSVTEGSTIYVHDGIYRENIVIYKTLELIGENKNTTILDGENNGDVVRITADGCRLQGFTVLNSSRWPYAGIHINSDNNSIIDNLVSNNGWGCHFYFSSNNTLMNNIFINNGITIVGNLTHWKDHTIKNNTANDRPIYYFVNKNNWTIPRDAGQVILVNCTNCILEQLSIANVDNAVTLAFSSNNFISQNDISSNNREGILLNSALNNVISENNLSNNSYGIYISSSSKNNFVIGNNVSSNKIFGIYVCCNSRKNVIYHNRFERNNKSAYDNNNNSWDNGTVGNYWSDYQEKYPDASSRDDFWNTSYHILGDNNQDNFPFVNSTWLSTVNDFILRFSTDKKSYQTNELVKITIKITNIGGKQVNLTFPNSKLVDFEILNDKDEQVYQWSLGKNFWEGIIKKTILIGETIELETTWNLRDNNVDAISPGNFSIRGWTATMPVIESNIVTINVQKDETIPGFEIVLLMIIIAMMNLSLRRKKKYQ